MNAKTTLSILVGLLSLGLASCQLPLDPPQLPHAGAGSARFSFQFDGANLGAKAALPTGLKALLVSLKNAEGETVLDRETLDLVPFGSSYMSVSLDLPTGDYAITEFLILDQEDEVKFATPVEGSELAVLVENPLPVEFSISDDVGTTVTLEVLEITETTDPEDLGYVVFDPVVVIPPFEFTFQVLGRQDSGETAPIRFFYEKRAVKNRTTGWSIGGGSFLRPAGVYEFNDGSYNWTPSNPVESFQLKVGSWGYKSSPLIDYSVEQLSPLRNQVPMATIVLEPEVAQVVMTRNGTTEAGLAKYRIRLAYSQFLEEAIAGLGGTAQDDYTFVIGFSLYAMDVNGSPYVAYPHWTTIRRISANGPGADGQDPYSYAPFNSIVAQRMNAYQSLEADLVLKDAAALEEVLDPERQEMVQVIVEVLALRDDGNDTIEGTEAFLGFKTSTLKVAPEHLTIVP